MIKLINPNSFEPKLIWSAIAGVGSAIGGALYNSHESDKARAWQTSEREAAQQYNTSERVASQQWQDMQRIAQNQFSEDMYNKYQSPEAMVNQYKAAGINPAAAIDKMPSGSINASSGSSGGAPSGTHVGTPGTSVPFQDVGAWANSFTSVANALKSLGDAKQTGIETKFLEDTFNERVRSEIRKADILDVDWNIKKLYGSATARASYERLMSEIAKNNADKDKINQELEILKKEGIIKDFDIDKLWDRWHHEVTNWAIGVGAAQQNIWESEERINQMKAVINNLNVDSTYKSRLSEQIKIGNEILKQTQKGEIDRIIATNKQIIDTIPQSIELLNQQLAIATKQNNWFVYNQIIDGIKVLAEVGLAAGVLKGKSGTPTSPPTHYHTHTGSTTNNIYNGGVAPM